MITARSDDPEVQTVELVRLVPDGRAETILRASVGPLPFYRRLSFVLLVAVPTLLSGLYFGGLAAPRFQSEVKFVVRSPASGAVNELATVLQGTGVVRENDDAFIAREYILSRDAMLELARGDGLLAAFDKAGIDLFWRYPGVWHSGNTQTLVEHYLNFVAVDYDPSSGISTLSVQAFEPADAQTLATALLDHTEAFLNGLNTRAQGDAARSAARDVDLARTRAYAALDAVTRFRNRETMVDPTLASKGVIASIAALSLEETETNGRLAELVTTAPQSPEIPTLRSRVTALQDQITTQRQLLGGGSSSLAPQIADYQRLLLDQQFAERAFTSALGALEAARLDATRQRVFLERVTTPGLPDAPAAPHRLLSVLATAAIGFGLWRVATAIGRDTRNHARS